MKRFTKMLSTLLAVATICTATLVPAFATTNNAGLFGTSENISSDNSVIELPISATYGLPKTGLIPDATFVYTLAPADPDTNEKTSDGHVITKGVAFTGTNTATWSVDAQHLEESNTTAPKLSSEDLKIALSIPATTASGIYRYELTQSVTTKKNEGAIYDDTTYRVNLYVQKPTDGDAFVYMVQVWEQDTTTNNWVKAEPTFANSITYVEDLEIKNYVVNNVTSDDVSFEFKFVVPVNSSVDTGVTLKDGTDLGAYILEADGVTKTPCDGEDGHPDKVRVSDTGNTITLFSGQTLVIPGVPVNMIYNVENAEANKAGFVSTYTTVIGTKEDGSDLDEPLDRSNFASAAESDGTTPHNVAATIVLGRNLIVFNNVNSTITATGVTSDSAPYIVMFVAAAGLAVLALAKKKITR